MYLVRFLTVFKLGLMAHVHMSEHVWGPGPLVAVTLSFHPVAPGDPIQTVLRPLSPLWETQTLLGSFTGLLFEEGTFKQEPRQGRSLRILGSMPGKG